MRDIQYLDFFGVTPEGNCLREFVTRSCFRKASFSSIIESSLVDIELEDSRYAYIFLLGFPQPYYRICIISM